MNPDPFLAAVEIVLESEGALSDNPHDTGGLTKYGISQAAFPDVDIENLTRDSAIELYRQYYWLKCRCDALPWALALPTFDGAVQHSPLRAVQFLQEALGVKVDGLIGQMTIDAAVACDKKAVLQKLMAERLLFYTGVPSWPTFKKGWAARIIKVTIAALS